MKLIWLTDIHLNFLDEEARMSFYKQILKTSGDTILITGDIAEAPSVSEFLKEMVGVVNKPIYFVLGNHDYYRGEINQVKKEMISLTEAEELLHWLPAAGVQDLGKGAVLLGEDAWADGRCGDYANSTVSLNDSRLIQDLFHAKVLGKYKLLEKMQELADHDAEQLKNNLINVIKERHPKKVIILMHVPPFKEACLRKREVSSDDFLPFFASKVMGDLLVNIAEDNPDTEFLVLCGHTHSEAHCYPRDNLTVKVGGVEYMKPEIQEIITL